MNTAVLEVRNITKCFRAPRGAAVHAVRGVSFCVQRGELLLIEGPSGSGKTTLLSIIGALAAPSTGSVVVAGTELTALSRQAQTAFRLRHIGFVLQTFRLLDALSVLDNVRLPLSLAGRRSGIGRERARELLDCVGLCRRAGVSPAVLSGGERQRVALARALANEPALLLADEPTGSLDAATGRSAMDLIAREVRSRGMAAVVVSHDARLRPFADTILTMEDGLLSTSPLAAGSRMSSVTAGALS